MIKKEATTKLDKAYVATKVTVYFSDSDEVAVATNARESWLHH